MGKVRDFLSDVVRQSDLVLLALCVTSTQAPRTFATR